MAIPKDWYVSALSLDVCKDLEKNPKIANELGSYYKKFIRYAAIQRVTYQADIKEEYEEFVENVLKKRLYNTDIKLWKRITKEILIRDNYTCAYCGQVGGILEVDHVIPISKGGTNYNSNLKTACRKCNRQKKDKSVDEFILWREKNG